MVGAVLKPRSWGFLNLNTHAAGTDLFMFGFPGGNEY